MESGEFDFVSEDVQLAINPSVVVGSSCNRDGVRDEGRFHTFEHGGSSNQTVVDDVDSSVFDDDDDDDDDDDVSGDGPSSYMVQDEDGSKGWIPIVQDDLKPSLNLTFSSYNEAESKYRSYADMAGFDVRLNARKINGDGIIQMRWFVCSKEGLPKPKSYDSLNVGPRERCRRNSNVKRVGCRACLKIHLNKDKSGYQVYDFVEVHNHVLFNSNDRRFSKKNRRLQYTDYKNILNSATYRLGSTKAYRIQTALKGGFERGRGTAVDYQNFKRDVGNLVGNKDAKMLIKKMSNRKQINNDYFFEYNVVKSELMAIFWADEVAQMNYREFGDIISFDATYRSNEHAMAFVPFMAVDNHKNSVVVASCLIAGENIENFKWVLQAFLKCYNKQPLVVLTDQDSAMKQAVPYVLTESRHRLCAWHIMNKLPSKVSTALSIDVEFNACIKKLVWNVHLSPHEFEEQWDVMVRRYGLVGDRWFTRMYKIRKSWIPAYYKDVPMSGLMKTTSRSESANAFFNIYVFHSLDLGEFLINYDSAMEKQREEHAKEENLTRTTLPQFVSPLPIELQAVKMYTRNVFFDFQKELKKAMWHCAIDRVEELEREKVYVINHQNKLRVSKHEYKVVYNRDTTSVDCICNFFVRNGYLCRHALKVLINEQVDAIPNQYILRRWTRNLVPANVQAAKTRYREVDTEKEDMFSLAYGAVDDIVTTVRNDKMEFKKFVDMLLGYKDKLSVQLPIDDEAQQKLDAIAEHYGVAVDEVDDEEDLYAPKDLCHKGSGTGKRLKGKSEKIQGKSKKKKRTCQRCGKATGHDSRNCPLVVGVPKLF